MNKLFILLFICISLNSKAEKDTAFYQYLKDHNLKLESFQLLKSVVENNEQLTVEEWTDFFTLSKTFNDTTSIKKIRCEMLGNDTTNIVRAFLISLHFNVESLSAACLGLVKEKCSVKTYQIFEEFFDVIYRNKVMNLRHPELQNIGHYIQKLESKIRLCRRLLRLLMVVHCSPILVHTRCKRVLGFLKISNQEYAQRRLVLGFSDNDNNSQLRNKKH